MSTAALFGSARWRRFAADPIGFFTELRARGGDVAVAGIGRDALVLVSHPDAVRELLVTRDAEFQRDPTVVRRWGGRYRPPPPAGLFQAASARDVHLRARRTLQPAFRRNRAAESWPQLVELARAASASVADGSLVDLTATFRRLFLQLGMATVFDSDLGVPEDELVNDVVACLPLRDYAATPVGELRAALSRDMRVIGAAHSRLLALVGELVESWQWDSTRPDALPTLLRRCAAAEGLTKDELRVEAFGQLFTFPDSTIHATCWTLLLLGRHPVVLERVREEAPVLHESGAEAFYGGGTPATYGAILEALRLYPVSWRIPRRALVDTEIGGRRIAAGSYVWVCQYLLHRDERFWVDPERFAPERWADRAFRPAPFSFLPFGGGNRRCPGEQLALLMAAASLSALVCEWEFEESPAAPVVPSFSGVLAPAGGLRLVARRRRTPALSR